MNLNFSPISPQKYLKECMENIFTDLRHVHISHNAPYLPSKILHKFCFSLLLGITAVAREIGGQIRCIMGDEQVAYENVVF